VGSRARIAAAACLVATGLLAGGAGVPAAVADTGSAAGNEEGADRHTGKTPRSDRARDGTESSAEKPDEPDEPAEEPAERPPEEPTGDDDGPGEVKTPGGRPDVGDGEVEDEPLPPCCEDGTDDCGPGWPWPWPWPVPGDPGDPSTSDGEYGENRPETLPPTAPMPPMGEPDSPGVLDVVPGIGAGSNDATAAPISVPIIITRPIGIAPAPAPAVGPPVGAGPAPGAGLPATPRQGASSPPPPRPQAPVPPGNSGALPGQAYRAGYTESLRSAGLPQLAALALPGLAGILVLTGAGGLVGYRQARAGQRIRPSGIARFMN
jgi:hypothetical protein